MVAYIYTRTVGIKWLSRVIIKKWKEKKEQVLVVSPSLWTSNHCCVHSLSHFGIYRRERERDGVCVWITLGGRRPSEGFCSAATSTSLLESRGLTLTCVTTTTTSKVLNRDLIFSTYILLYYAHIYPVGSKNNTYNIFYTNIWTRRCSTSTWERSWSFSRPCEQHM